MMIIVWSCLLITYKEFCTKSEKVLKFVHRIGKPKKAWKTFRAVSGTRSRPTHSNYSTIIN